MSWNDALTDLQDKLVGLYPRLDSWERIATQAGINISMVRSNAAPIDVWHETLVEAHNSKPSRTPEIIAIVSREHPEHAETLEQIGRRYQALMGPDQGGEFENDLFFDFSHSQTKWYQGRKNLHQVIDGIQTIASEQRWNVRHIQHADALNKLPLQAVLVLICPWHAELQPEEIRGLADWVGCGGRLLALGFYSMPHHRTNVDQLMNLFGFCFEHNVLLPVGAIPADGLTQATDVGDKYVVRIDISQMTSGDPLLNGIKTLGLQSACSLKVHNADPQEVNVVLDSGTQPLIWEPQNIQFDECGKYWRSAAYVVTTRKERPLIVKRIHRHGKVIAIGTWKVFCDDFVGDTTLGNRQLFQNIMDWLR